MSEQSRKRWPIYVAVMVALTVLIAVVAVAGLYAFDYFMYTPPPIATGTAACRLLPTCA